MLSNLVLRIGYGMTHKPMVVLVAGVLLLFASFGCAAHRTEVGGISRLGYSIQVGAFKNVHNAERLAAKLQAKGIDAFYFKKDDGVYAVRFGDFTSYAIAKSNGSKLVNEKVIGSFFIADPSQVPLAKAKEPELRQDKSLVSSVKTPRDTMGNIAARTAERFVGIPYRWGGNTVVDGMDCSGFVRAVYNLCGVNIPRTSREQFKVGDEVAKSDLFDGDLVFFGVSAEEISHVGIYVGNGRFVHAPRRGDDIKVSSLDENYFVQKFVGAKRYF
jgi:cell wall-associated NlpC family hydrolase